MESHKIHVPNHQSVYIHKMIEHGMDLDGPEIIWNPHALPPESIRLWCQPCLRSMFHEHILDEIFDIVQDQVWDTQIIKCFVDLLFLCLKMGQMVISLLGKIWKNYNFVIGVHVSSISCSDFLWKTIQQWRGICSIPMETPINVRF